MNSTKNSAMQTCKAFLDKLGIWAILVLLFLFLSVTTGDTFLTASNLINLIRQICVTGVCAIGAAIVVCGGELDLSSGSLAALAGCASAMLAVNFGWPTWLAFVAAIAGGACIDALIGCVIAFLRVPAFIATLGMMYVLDGFTLLMTRGTPITNLPDSYKFVGRGYIGPIPFIVVILLSLVAVFAFIFKYTQFGRNIVSVGENATAAHLSGINVRLIKIASFACAGILSSLAGIMLMARLGSGQPTAASDLCLTAMAAVFVGGTSAINTQGAAFKTLAGALFIGMINNGLNMLEINAYWQKIVLGFIIISAIALDVYRTQQASRRS